jgi:hypothetical protein
MTKTKTKTKVAVAVVGAAIIAAAGFAAVSAVKSNKGFFSYGGQNISGYMPGYMPGYIPGYFERPGGGVPGYTPGYTPGYFPSKKDSIMDWFRSKFGN